MRQSFNINSCYITSERFKQKMLFLGKYFVFVCLKRIIYGNDNIVPYSITSPWNTPIPSDVKVSPNSDHYLSLWTNNNPLRSTIDEYDETLYIINASTIMGTVYIANDYSIVSDNNSNLTILKKPTLEIPIPLNSVGSPGSDSEIILWDIGNNIEYGFWQFKSVDSLKNSYSAENGYQYNTTWNGIPPKGFHSRGAGVPYMLGLLRKWEIQNGSIQHALAVTVSNTSPQYVYPATKSDGKQSDGIPEGSRIQIKPEYTETDFKNWGLNSTGIIIAQCLQKYGMFVIDSTGGSGGKIIPEDTITANWDGILTDHTITPIPKDALRFVETEQLI